MFGSWANFTCDVSSATLLDFKCAQQKDDSIREESEVNLIAGEFIPKNTVSHFFEFELKHLDHFLRRFGTDTQSAIKNYSSVIPDEKGILEFQSLNSKEFKLSMMTPAQNIHDQNCSIEHLTSTDRAILRIRTIKDIQKHSNLNVWLNEELGRVLFIPVLSLQNIRGGGLYRCQYCQKDFTEPNPLKAHLYLQRCTMSVEAPVEEEDLSSVQNIKTNKSKTADNSKPRNSKKRHLCSYCGRLYSRRYGLKIHIRTHTGYKPLRCKFCLRAFGDPSNLNKHTRLHLDQGLRETTAKKNRRLAPHAKK